MGLSDWNDLHALRGLSAVKQQLREALKQAANDPNERLAQENGPPPTNEFNWRDNLQMTGNGTLLTTQYNAALILDHDQRWQNVLAYDEFRHCIAKRSAPPFDGSEAGEWNDIDANKLLMWLQGTYQLNIKQAKVADDAARAVAWDNRWHPVRHYLESLPKWNGDALLGHLFPGVFGAEFNEYTEFLGKALLVAMVARVMNPGCKVDEMIVLESVQGTGKSTALRELASPEFYLETSESPSGKDFLVGLQGAWLVEIGEMQSFSKAERNLVKQIITRRDDKFRAPYDRYATSHPRQCVFVGTTNDDSYLSDPTGARRFLPITITCANVSAIRKNRDLYFAEALHLYREGFKWWDYPKERAQFEQDERYQEDTWEKALWEYVQGEGNPNKYPGGLKPSKPMDKVTVSELMEFALGLSHREQTKQEQMRVGGILRHWGWTKAKQARVQGARVRHFLRPQPKQAAPP